MNQCHYRQLPRRAPGGERKEGVIIDFPKKPLCSWFFVFNVERDKIVML